LEQSKPTTIQEGEKKERGGFSYKSIVEGRFPLVKKLSNKEEAQPAWLNRSKDFAAHNPKI